MAKEKITVRLPQKVLTPFRKDRAAINTSNDIIVATALHHWFATESAADRKRKYLLTATPYQRAA